MMVVIALDAAVDMDCVCDARRRDFGLTRDVMASEHSANNDLECYLSPCIYSGGVWVINGGMYAFVRSLRLVVLTATL